jgi:hypothetical protein
VSCIFVRSELCQKILTADIKIKFYGSRDDTCGQMQSWPKLRGVLPRIRERAYKLVLVKLSVCHVTTVHARCHIIDMSRDHSTRSSCQTIGMSRDHIESPP